VCPRQGRSRIKEKGGKNTNRKRSGTKGKGISVPDPYALGEEKVGRKRKTVRSWFVRKGKHSLLVSRKGSTSQYVKKKREGLMNRFSKARAKNAEGRKELPESLKKKRRKGQGGDYFALLGSNQKKKRGLSHS